MGFFDDSGPALVLSADPLAPTRLFNINVVTLGTFAGVVPVAITSSGVPNQFEVGTSAGVFSSPGSGVTLVGGSITAVPEPSGLGLLGLAFAAAAMRRRRAA